MDQASPELVAYAEIEARVHTMYERSTATFQYIVADPSTNKAVIIDPVLDAGNSNISTTAADTILSVVRENGYTVDRILDTRAGTPNRSSAWYLRTQLQAKTGSAPRISIGKSIAGVQRLFARKYGIQDAGWDFDSSFEDGEVFPVGNIRAHALALPAQAPDHMGYLIANNVFIGDPSLTAVQDLSESDFDDEMAHQRGTSVQRLLGMPREFRIYTSHRGQATVEVAKPFATVEELRAQCKGVPSSWEVPVKRRKGKGIAR